MKQAKETSTSTTMEKQQHTHDEEEEEHDTISLSDFHMDNDTKTGSEEVNNTSTFDQDFFGININSNEKMEEETNPAFRSNSGSFRYMRFKVGSRTGSWRSRSLSVMASKSKSRWQVFMSGFGSGRFPAKMDMVDIKTRQLRSQSTAKVSESEDRVCAEESGGRRVRKKVWWRLVDVLGCGGGYERNNMVVA